MKFPPITFSSQGVGYPKDKVCNQYSGLQIRFRKDGGFQYWDVVFQTESRAVKLFHYPNLAIARATAKSMTHIALKQWFKANDKTEITSSRDIRNALDRLCDSYSNAAIEDMAWGYRD